MAKRYSGSLQINVTYDNRGHYRTSVSSGGKLLWRGGVKPAPAGFGPGIAYDSPQAYDKVASSALAFADDEVRGIGDEADFDENLTGYLIKRTKGKTASAHAAKLKRGVRDSRIQRGNSPTGEGLKQGVGDAWIQRARHLNAPTIHGYNPAKKTEAQLKAEVDAVLSSKGGRGRSRR
jgi:hypothetical protein